MNKIKHLEGKVGAIEKDSVRVIASSGNIDRDGDILNPAGWLTDRFMKNPVLLWSHQAHQLPIGRVNRVFPEGNNLVAEVEFAEKENDFAKKVAQMVRNGFINAVSVGFMPIEYDENGHAVKQELLELSFVSVPANADALVSHSYKSFMKEVEKMEEGEEKKTEVKSPECRQEGESKDECVARKIPEIMRDDPSMKREQATAMAFSMCDMACGMKSEEAKKLQELRLDEETRTAVRIAIEANKQSAETLEKILSISKPPEKKGEEKQITKSFPKKDGHRLLRVMRLADQALGLGLQIMKGGEKK